MKPFVQRSFFTLLAAVIAWSVQAQYDDVYYDPFAPASTTSNTTSAFYDDGWADDGSGYDNQFYEWEDYTGYEYSSRIRRFHRPAGNMGYYSPAYVDRFYYDPFYYSPYAPWSYGTGVTIYMGHNPYRFHRHRYPRYRPYRTTIVYTNNPWWFYGPGYSVTTVYSYGPGWGWNNPYAWNPYGYNPYYPYGGYSWYNTGYYGGYYGGYGGYYAHCPTFYGAGPAYFTTASTGNQNTHYGPRGALASNTPQTPTASTGAGIRNNNSLSNDRLPAREIASTPVDRQMRARSESIAPTPIERGATVNPAREATVKPAVTPPVRSPQAPARSAEQPARQTEQPARSVQPPATRDQYRPYTPERTRTPQQTAPAPREPRSQPAPPPVRRTEPQRQMQPQRSTPPATSPRQQAPQQQPQRRSGGFESRNNNTSPAPSSPAPSRSVERSSPPASSGGGIQRGSSNNSSPRSTAPSRRGGGE